MSIRLFNSDSGKHVDVLYALLVTTDETQFFPELYEVFGRDAVIKFLDVFAGQTITVPPVEVIESKIRDATVWVEMQKGNKMINEVAAANGMTCREVQQACNRVHKALSKLGIVVKNVRS